MLTKFTFLVVVCVAMAMAIEWEFKEYEGGHVFGFLCRQLDEFLDDVDPKYIPNILSQLDGPLEIDDQCWITLKTPNFRAMDG